ncbi:hypothetical protein FH972_002690 [Carpinus fangiana]|uniref:SOSEKI DIX-like domain-containing protein n=1 Tax=Carpinus fangiana TaxID=176857 RepID=A0A5N6QI89_9ROSI|nr:hypothetical protein FH972_002690 [Carpinus fangiana]
MDVRSRRARETSPDRVKVYMHQQQQRVKPIKKVQVVYYLSRNGNLEHPHYMEVTHLPNQPLRLRDVMERLTVLRGKGMPSLYSWSCKRSYKSGYVWNDLAENDIIYPAEGAEFVLKGSELVEGCSERFQQLQISNMQEIQQIQEPNYHSKRKPVLDQEFEEYEEGEDFEDGEKTSYTSSTTPQSRCSRGVSTDELEDNETQQPEIQKNPPELTLNESSPPSTTSSTDSDKANQSNNNSKRVVEDGDPVGSQRGNNSKRFEPGNPVANESAPSRNSVLLQLIACGGSAAAKSKSAQSLRQPAVKKSDSLHRGVLCKSAAMVGEEDMIRYMSENPRFGNLQAEEKEYFSGSIVESMTLSEDRVVAEPVLKRSNSFNEERSKRVGLGEAMEEEKREKAAVKGKCLPRKKSFASMKQAKK